MCTDDNYFFAVSVVVGDGLKKGFISNIVIPNVVQHFFLIYQICGSMAVGYKTTHFFEKVYLELYIITSDRFELDSYQENLFFFIEAASQKDTKKYSRMKTEH